MVWLVYGSVFTVELYHIIIGFSITLDLNSIHHSHFPDQHSNSQPATQTIWNDQQNTHAHQHINNNFSTSTLLWSKPSTKFWIERSRQHVVNNAERSTADEVEGTRRGRDSWVVSYQVGVGAAGAGDSIATVALRCSSLGRRDWIRWSCDYSGWFCSPLYAPIMPNRLFYYFF